MTERITSLQNKYIKLANSLKLKKYRDENGLFITEGIRLAEEALASGWSVEFCICTAEALNSQRTGDLIAALAGKRRRIFEVPPALYEKLSDTDQPQGIMLVLKKRTYTLQELFNRRLHGSIVILDHVQDPGNAGTIIRTADAAGCAAVILTQGCADIFAAKTVRATMGSLFHLPVVEEAANAELINALKTADIPLFATALTGADLYFKADLRSTVAIVFGNEGNGVSEEILSGAQARLYVPICGKAESLNVATAAAVILYEAVRQRGL